jgi:hypothetical protein
MTPPCAGLGLLVGFRCFGQVQRRDPHPSASNGMFLADRTRVMYQSSSFPLKLPAQLNAIAREFSLPSIGGLTLHLSLVENGQTMKPRITEEACAFLVPLSEFPEGNLTSGFPSFCALFGHFFDVDFQEAYAAQSVARLAAGTGNLTASAHLRKPTIPYNISSVLNSSR